MLAGRTGLWRFGGKNAPRNPATQVPADTAEILKKYGKLDKTPLTVEVKGDQPIDLKLD
jgi:hypothetical protein